MEQTGSDMSDQEFHGIRASSAVDALGIAAANGLHKEIQSLLTEGVDINGIAEYSGNTPLTSAAGQGRHRTVALLLESGADLEHAPVAAHGVPTWHCSWLPPGRM